MRAVGWSNGSPNNETGAGYGIRIRPEDRDRHFDRAWRTVTVRLEGDGEASCSAKGSFWRCCPELRSQVIGRWMLEHEWAPWPYRQPPEFELEPIGKAAFRLRKI